MFESIMEASPEPIIHAALAGHGDAAESERVEDVMPEIYGQLRALASRYFAGERGSTLQPTALVHEAFLRLREQKGLHWRSRTHFFALAAREVRRVLVDHWRRTAAMKRDGLGGRVPLEAADGVPDPAGDGMTPDDVLALDEALDGLAREHPRQARVAEMAYFAGLTQAEIGELLQLSRKTIAADWSFARAWLARELSR